MREEGTYRRIKQKLDFGQQIPITQGIKLIHFLGYDIIWWGLKYKKRCISIYKEL